MLRLRSRWRSLAAVPTEESTCCRSLAEPRRGFAARTSTACPSMTAPLAAARLSNICLMIIDYLRREFSHVSAERVVSGAGLENLYRAVIAIDGIEAPKRNAAEITNAALDGTCPTARAAVDLFCAMLGTFAGNVALMFGARGGVFIAGGIAPRLTEYIARSEFRARFEHKGRFREYLASIPSSIIVHPAATFMGLRSIAERKDKKISLDRTHAEPH
jgi:glucokinase